MKTILVVDDEYDFVDAVCSLLESEGYRAIPAGSGKAALEAMERQRPSLILLDVMMPKQSGLELLERLQAHPEHRSVPVVLMSASREPAREPGRSQPEFLAKPFDVEKLLEIAARHTGKQERSAS
jgi:CheY-like chemotaxis protein